MSSKQNFDLVVRFAAPMSDIDTLADVAYDVERLLGHYVLAKHIDVFFRQSDDTARDMSGRPFPTDDDPDCQHVELRHPMPDWAVDFD